MKVQTASLHHLALTVRDLDASTEWYGRVFGIKPRLEVPHQDQGGLGRLLTDDAWQLLIALHRHDSTAEEMFHESRPGLDHIALAVATRDDLVAWQSHLETLGVARAEAADRPLTQAPIADEAYGCVLVFRDPDNIQLELFVPSKPN